MARVQYYSVIQYGVITDLPCPWNVHSTDLQSCIQVALEYLYRIVSAARGNKKRIKYFIKHETTLSNSKEDIYCVSNGWFGVSWRVVDVI